MASLHDRGRVSQHLKQLARDAVLEAHCGRCGDCCRFAFIAETADGPRRLMVPQLSCIHLREDGTLTSCEVYGDRARRAWWCCLELTDQLVAGLSGQRCTYLQGAAWIQPALALDPDEIEAHLPRIAEILAKVAGTVRRDDLARFISRWDLADRVPLPDD